MNVYLKKELFDIIENSSFLTKKASRILGLKPKRFYSWRRNYSLFGVDALIDEEPIAKVILNKLLKEEEEAISKYALSHPEERHREVQFNLDQQGIATVSFSSVY